MTMARKTLSIFLALAMIMGGILIVTPSAKAEGSTIYKNGEIGGVSAGDPNAYITIDITNLDDGDKPVPNFGIWVTWIQTYTELNPLNGFLSSHDVRNNATYMSNAIGRIDIKLSIDTGVGIHDITIHSNDPDFADWPPYYYGGELASHHLYLKAEVQPSEAYLYGQSRADTLGMIQSWYEQVPYTYSLVGAQDKVKSLNVTGSQTQEGAILFNIDVTGTSSLGFNDYNATGGINATARNGPINSISLDYWSSTSNPSTHHYTAELVVYGLNETDTQVYLFILGTDYILIDITGHWGTWQTSGLSSTLTDQNLVPVRASVLSVYPLLISNPRWDSTPIANDLNGLKFDVYNLADRSISAAITLRLLADNGTQVWASTVGMSTYPAWGGSSNFTAVHLINVNIAATERKEYNLAITSGNAVTDVPVVFYPAALDPAIVYADKTALDALESEYSSATVAAKAAYYIWAEGLKTKANALEAEILNMSKSLTVPRALSEIAAAKDDITRALDMIAQVQKECKDESFTNYDSLKASAEGSWQGYIGALLHEQSAIAFENGDDAFGNSTSHDAFYYDIYSKSNYDGTNDFSGDESQSTASTVFWIAIGIAVIAGILVFIVIFPKLGKNKKSIPGFGLIGEILPMIIAAAVAALVAVIVFYASEGALTALASAYDSFIKSLPSLP